MKPLLLSALAAFALASPAAAGEITLTVPFEAYRLSTGNVDMIAYQTDLGDGGYEVTAYARARDSYSQPQRLMMRLKDRDSVTFAMPSEPRILYTFARKAELVTVTSRYVPMELASN
ncbi:hypothetical protein SAMN05444722_1131 [Rhodovulum sp. ES.010]|uniref:hypothetical protein n=1 Tax=Rhodovulum sp. ES.010 TaxID=1882821 RepID=UPI0009286511|nr:hypothetical protein [Rhodovulum sp. ES.010]SIO27309.1 hypothetical protein SAMN05444722_1131 [Rhodovulum sp. ES.010]